MKNNRETLRLLTKKLVAKGQEKSNPEKLKNDSGRMPKRQSDRHTTTQPKAEFSSKKDIATTYSDLQSTLKSVSKTLRETRMKQDLCLRFGPAWTQMEYMPGTSTYRLGI
jgi:hypothetical protein